jgi:hypothetical protein
MQEANRSHSLYLSDADDEFDNTYATFYFRIPDPTTIAGLEPEKSRNEKWLEAIAALQAQIP